MEYSISHIFNTLREYWTADHEINPYITVSGGICLACLLIFLSRMFDRSLHVRYLGIVDIINLLVFIAATCVYPASYAAHHTELKSQREFSITNIQEFLFWFFFTSAIVGIYSKRHTLTLLGQCVVFSIVLAYNSDIVTEVEERFDLLEFFAIWCTLFVAFGLLPILVLQDQLMTLLVYFKKFFYRRYKFNQFYEYLCYFLFGSFIRIWYELILYNTFESVRLGVVLYLGIHLILPMIFSM